MNLTISNLLGLHASNQLLLPLCHVPSIISGCRSITNSRSSKSVKDEKKNKKLKDKLDVDVNNRTVIDDVDSLMLARESVSKVLNDATYHQAILRHLNRNKHSLNGDVTHDEVNQHTNWLKSNVSGWTFDENKYGKLNMNHTCLSSSLFALYGHYNHSKLSVRWYSSKPRAQFLGMGQHKISSSPRLDSILNSDIKFPLVFKNKKDKSAKAESERLKSLLGDSNLSVEDKQKMKVAFAEGYLAAEPGKSRVSSKMRIFNIFRDLLGIVLILAILFSFMGGSFKRVLIGSTNEVHPEEIDVTFNDVKGVEEAKQELQEVVEFLKNPSKFSSLGGKLPKGVLLVGPPGTGKTLLARAVAGEAGVPFFHAAGPEFDEILVGQGARRVRDLFSTAKARAPCVVFIDEIDSVGAKRTNSVLHPYANQTINQLLTEMDGFRQNEGVIVLGATNRRQDLDKALLRPGRFDVEIQVPTPDFTGRREILELYLGKVKLDDDVDIDMLARGTTGFTGADLENMVNQAALRGAIEAAESVNMKYLLNSRDKVLMGPERKSRIPDEECNKITAYHESGHAIVSLFTKESHPLHKITIIPRGGSLGHTAYIPEKERYHLTKAQILASIDSLMGGRAAEELIFGPENVTTGDSDDLVRATDLATHMVKKWGMSDRIGVRTFKDNENTLVTVNELSATTSETIDSEIKKILQDSLERAKTILKNHSREHKLLAEALLKHETLDAEEVKAIMAGKDPRE